MAANPEWPMNPWFAKAIILAGSIAIVIIPHRQHGQRSRETKVVKSRKGPLEVVLLTLVSLGPPKCPDRATVLAYNAFVSRSAQE
jgi:hypothetical protein